MLKSMETWSGLSCIYCNCEKWGKNEMVHIVFTYDILLFFCFVLFILEIYNLLAKPCLKEKNPSTGPVTIYNGHHGY